MTEGEIQRAKQAIRRARKSVWTIDSVYLAKALKCEEPDAADLIEAIKSEEVLRDEIHESPKPRPELLEPVQEHRLKKENRLLRDQLNEALGRQVLNQQYQEFVAEVAQYRSDPPEWTLKPRVNRARQAMPVAHLSDAHFDEKVFPEQVGYVNAYSRPIAEMRLRRFFEKTITLCDDYLKGVDYPGFVLCVSGDMFSGNIHEELKETNEAGLCASLRYWLDPMAAGISLLADRFGRVDVHWVVGNHPRMEKKPRAKGGVQENMDHLLGSLLQRDFGRAKDQRVTFHVSEAFDHYFKIFNSGYLQTHGDQFKGGSGIAAELSPMLIGDSRKREKQQAINQPYDYLICGHWHRRLCLPSVKVNGALVGYSEFAAKMNLKYQEPLQSFWLDTPEHGITVEAPIYVKADKEGWELDRKAA